jgi:hypothetical protein
LKAEPLPQLSGVPALTTADIEYDRAARQAESGHVVVELIRSPRIATDIQRGTELLLDPRKLVIPVLNGPRHIVIITGLSTGCDTSEGAPHPAPAACGGHCDTAGPAPGARC